MSDNIKLDISLDGITNKLNGMLSRANLVDGWLNRVAYPQIIQHQRQRWMTEGASEGEQWKPLNPKYRLRKLSQFRDYPGAGTKMLIATGKLVDSITGDNKTDHYKIVSGKCLEMGTKVSYAKYVDETRNFTRLSDQTIEDLKAQLRAYLGGN